MTADALLAQSLRSTRTRASANDALLAMPLVLVAAAAAWRWHGLPAAALVALAGTVACLAVALWRARRFDRHWLVRGLDARRADMEDSAGLLFAADAALNPLERLQRARLAARLADAAPELRAPWPARRLAAVWSLATLAVAAIVWLPTASDPVVLVRGAEGRAMPGAPRLVAQSLRVAPPAYTGLPARDAPGLDARVPQGSRLTWTLRFRPQPDAAALMFYDGAALPLRRAGDAWTATRTVDRSTLYRVVPRGGERPAPPLHRIDAIPDLPPRIEVRVPDRSLTLVTAAQPRWSLAFDVRDDHGVAVTAALRLLLAQGDGENISFRERVVTLRGTGGARQKQFSTVLDLAALGFAPGNDLVAQLTARDNRAPAPQLVRGPSVILRWSPDAGNEATGLDAMVRKTLPAYFRSQRQIIIDAEALLAQKRRLAPDRFVARSDGIGVDQRILRLRYGQFAGEQAEGGARPPPPTNDAEAAPAPAPAHDHDGAPDHGDDFDHGGSARAAPGFGAAVDVLKEYGHTHDIAEAATLLDPETRATLRKALDAMWQSELELRQGAPDRALPYANQALVFIKAVQQATRIFLARTGPDLPPVDETRRLTGKRDGLARRDLALAVQGGVDAVPAAAWRALDDAPGAGRAGVPLDALDRWLRDNTARVPDPLALVAAIDAVRRDPACIACRRALRGLLWSVQPRPPAGVARRGQGGAGGGRYLDAVRQAPAE